MTKYSVAYGPWCCSCLYSVHDTLCHGSQSYPRGVIRVIHGLPPLPTYGIDIKFLINKYKRSNTFKQVRLGYVGQIRFVCIRLGQERLGQERIGYIRLHASRSSWVWLQASVSRLLKVSKVGRRTSMSIVLFFLMAERPRKLAVEPTSHTHSHLRGCGKHQY